MCHEVTLGIDQLRKARGHGDQGDRGSGRATCPFTLPELLLSNQPHPTKCPTTLSWLMGLLSSGGCEMLLFLQHRE